MLGRDEPLDGGRGKGRVRWGGAGGWNCEKVNSESERRGHLPHVPYIHTNTNNEDKQQAQRQPASSRGFQSHRLTP